MRVLASLIVFISFTSQSIACTTFNFTDRGRSVVGKSYDWGLGHGMIATMKRNVQKKAVTPTAADVPAQWVSKYSSVIFSQFGIEFPLGGINEQGLNVEIMWLSSSKYPAVSEDPNPAINELQWIQYILDTASTASEAIAQAQKVRVAPLLAKVHYLACDRDSQCATFEYINKRLVINSGPNLALTNNTADESVRYRSTFEGFGGSDPLPAGETHSLDRFVLASAGIRDFRNQTTTADYAMSVLQSVSNPGFSKWNIVYDQGSGQIHFRTDSQRMIKNFDFTGFNPSCKTAIQVLDINSSLAGDVTQKFSVYTKAFNDQMIEANDFLTQNLIDMAEKYPTSTTCLE